MNYFGVSYEFHYLSTLIVFAIFAIMLYEGNNSKKVFFSSIYIAIVFASDTIASTLPIAVLDKELATVLVGGPLRITATLFYVSCISSFVFVSHFIKWKIISMSPVETISFIIVCFIGLFLDNIYPAYP